MSSTAPKVYTEFVPHVDRIKIDPELIDHLPKEPRTDEDYANCKKVANDIGYQLLQMKQEDGTIERPRYWQNEEFEGLNPIDIEARIIRDVGRAAYGGYSPYGKPIYVHWLTMTKLMFPDTDITPVLADITELFLVSFGHGRKYLHLLGSQDSGKSSTIARLIFGCMKVDSKHTFAPVASPFVNTAETIIWGDILELFDQLCEHHPLDDTGHKATSVFPQARVKEGRINFTAEGSGKAGWAAVRNLKKAGKLIGSKNIGSDPRVGIGLIPFDELNRAENTGFTTELANVAGQDWFQMVTAQNPVDEDDVGGQFCAPKIWKGWGYASFDDIRKEMPTIWPTEKSGIAYRLNGLDSVNMRIGKIIYPYQFHHKKHQRLIDDYGEQSPEYYSQCLALFAGAEIDVRLLSQSRVSKSKHDDEFFTLRNVKGKILFCDPAHTGKGDKAAVGWAEFGDGIITNTDGSQDEIPLFVIREPMEHIKFVNNFTWEADADDTENLFVKKFAELGCDFNDITVGAPITYEEQIALRMAEIAKTKNIPYRNVGYDFSMRYEMVAAATMIMGNDPVPFDYNTKAIGYELHRTKENTADKCPQSNGRTFELGHLAADLFNSKQLRGGQHIRVAIIQTCKTRILDDKPHKPFEKKAEYKARNENKSPDERDTFFGMVGMAFLRGFRNKPVHVAQVGSESVFKRSLKNGRGRRKIGKRI